MNDTPQPAEGQCAFFLPKKKRFCRFRPNQGQTYCAEHAFVLGVELERKRIVCPLNAKHTCYEDNLAKHLKKCNSRKRRTEEYYEEGINTGSDERDSVTDTSTAVRDTSTDKLKQMIEKVNQIYEEHVGRLDVDIKSHECLHDEMDNPYFGLSALRHRRQQASLIGQLDKLGLLKPGFCYVEMGAGKGQLSHWVREAVSSHDDAAFLLVDRSSIRYKVDGYHKEEEKVKFERVKMDIEHLNLGKVPMIAKSNRPLVAIGKHLCGAATDLTLRCLMKTVGCRSTMPPSSTEFEPSAKRLKTDDTSSSDSPFSQALLETHNSAEPKDTEDSDTLKLTNLDRERQKLECATAAGEINTNSNEKDVDNTGDVKCLSDDSTEKPVNTSSVHKKNVHKDNQVAGVLIALCCHHQCTWKSYVGKDFMHHCGITAADFSLMTRLTSWAVCGWRDKDGSFSTKQDAGSSPSEEGEKMSSTTKQNSPKDSDTSNMLEESEHNTKDLLTGDNQIGLQLTEKQKETVGWKCKRLIDYGRARYLQDCGLHSQLKIYIDAEQTPENVVLLAMPQKNEKDVGDTQ